MKTTIKKELISLLSLDIAVIFMSIITVFTAYILCKFAMNESLTFFLMIFTPIISPAIFFIIGYRRLKLKNLLWINHWLISVLLLLLNFIVVVIINIFISLLLQNDVMHIMWWS
jgi:hypothetical protein